jgi:hypothetical protein
MNPKERKELAVSKLLLIVLAVIGLAVVVWLAWLRPAPHQAVTTEDVSLPDYSKNKSADELKPSKDETKYLIITEWGVRAPLTSETYDIEYSYQPLEGNSVTFTFKRLVDAGICDPGVGVAMSRSTKHNQPPYNLDNPEPIAQVNGYSYYLSYAGEPCTATANDTQKQIANDINGGDINAAVKATLQKLEAVK